MPKVETIKVAYSETRSSEYQSATVGSEVTLSLEDGENAGAIWLQYLKALQDRVGPQAVDRVEFLIQDKKQRGWK